MGSRSAPTWGLRLFQLECCLAKGPRLNLGSSTQHWKRMLLPLAPILSSTLPISRGIEKHGVKAFKAAGWSGVYNSRAGRRLRFGCTEERVVI
jgi:hypothetical protein